MKRKKTSGKLNLEIQQLLSDTVEGLLISLSELASAAECHVTYNMGGGEYCLLRVFN